MDEEPAFTFSVRVDSGAPRIEPDSATVFPFGHGNVYRVRASDPNGSVSKYLWSTRSDRFTDSTDGPSWILPDSLVHNPSIYFRARDNDGILSNEGRASLTIIPKVFGGNSDYFQGLAQLPGGGMLAVGYTGTLETRLGEPWAATFTGAGRLKDQVTVKRHTTFGIYGSGAFESLSPASNGGFIATGFYKDSTHEDGLAAKFDGDGALLWKTFLNGPGHQRYQTSVQTQSENHILFGYSKLNPPLWDTTLGLLSAISPTGEILFSKTLSRGKALSFYSATLMEDGNILVVALGSFNLSQQRPFLYKLTPEGEILWERVLDIAGSVSGLPHRLKPSRTGGFGLLIHAHGKSVVLRLDKEGAVVWQRDFFAMDQERALYGDLLETPEGDWIVACSLPNKAIPSGIRIQRLNSLGEPVWHRNVGTYSDRIQSLTMDSTGTFIAAGGFSNLPETSYSGAAWILGFSSDGRLLW
jgi:hypothetical protein